LGPDHPYSQLAADLSYGSIFTTTKEDAVGHFLELAQRSSIPAESLPGLVARMVADDACIEMMREFSQERFSAEDWRDILGRVLERIG
jgi:hypothetical protein